MRGVAPVHTDRMTGRDEDERVVETLATLVCSTVLEQRDVSSFAD